MFRSKIRPIVITQSEHARLSGVIAQLWGNSDFEQPRLPFDSFLKGVIFHDRGYPEFDNAPINEIDESEWLAIQKRGIKLSFSDNVADIIVKMQLLRLLGYQPSAERNACANELKIEISQQIKESPFEKQLFDFADRITCFADSLAYDFCFERPTENKLPIQARNDSEKTQTVSYTIETGGKISVSPWPFSVATYSGFITGYESDGYPERREPVVVPFSLTPS